MKKTTALLLLVLLLAEIPILAGVGSKNARYVGGTLTDIKEGTEGKVSTDNEKFFTFTAKHGNFNIQYDRINSLEYGQKAGRRVGLAIVVSPIALFSKKRKHFLTIGFQDDNDKQQAAVLELGKGIVRTTLAILEARSGRKIEFQDEEARHSSKGD